MLIGPSMSSRRSSRMPGHPAGSLRSPSGEDLRHDHDQHRWPPSPARRGSTLSLAQSGIAACLRLLRSAGVRGARPGRRERCVSPPDRRTSSCGSSGVARHPRADGRTELLAQARRARPTRAGWRHWRSAYRLARPRRVRRPSLRVTCRCGRSRPVPCWATQSPTRVVGHRVVAGRALLPVGDHHALAVDRAGALVRADRKIRSSLRRLRNCQPRSISEKSLSTVIASATELTKSLRLPRLVTVPALDRLVQQAPSGTAAGGASGRSHRRRTGCAGGRSPAPPSPLKWFGPS